MRGECWFESSSFHAFTSKKNKHGHVWHELIRSKNGSVNLPARIIHRSYLRKVFVFLKI